MDDIKLVGNKPRQYPLIISGSNIITPGQLHCTLDIPDFFTNDLKFCGYQDAHRMYDLMQNYFAQQAYATHNSELIVVKMTMKSLKPGNQLPSIVSISKRPNNNYIYLLLCTRTSLRLLAIFLSILG